MAHKFNRYVNGDHKIEPNLMNQSSNQSALEQFKAHLGDQHVLVSDADKAGYLVEWRDKYFGQAAAVLRPKTVQEISTIVKIANAKNVALVPQGGNTGLVGGQIAFDAERQFVVNMSRMNTVREIDADGYTMTVDAGVVLEAAQNAANSACLLYTSPSPRDRQKSRMPSSA